MHFAIFFKLLLGFTGMLLAGTAILHGLPSGGSVGRKISEAFCRAPLLDWVVFYFVVLPLILGPICAGWKGLFSAICAQFLSGQIWVFTHEWIHRNQTHGPRIYTVLNRIVGRWRNHLALWATTVVAPIFWIVRFAELLVYPLLIWLVGLPRYDHAEWVNVSRQKFKGLVGHDLVWCLYCDWMTGVISLCNEMLRNVESFWCPIRFASDKKCANCSVDFPDINAGWIEAGGSMEDVARKLEEMYAGGDHSWFGKRVQMTINGKTV